MKEEDEQPIGVFVFLALLLAAHIVCWIASVVKAIIDRKTMKRKARAAKSEHLLAETQKVEREEKNGLALPINVNDDRDKFAIPRARMEPSSPTSPISPSEHHFPRCPKRHLSTGGAKRISPEQLAVMLDNYAAKREPDPIDPPVVPSPTRLVAKGITTVNA